MIREAKPEDISGIRDIEIAAGVLFRGLGMDAIADDTPPSQSDLAPYLRDGRAWVATDPADNPIAYILVDVIDSRAHIEQVSVHPAHSRKGLGSALIDHVERWAAARSLQGMTLTTFSDVPWNAPYYERLGFRTLPEEAWSDGLREIVREEVRHGLGAWPRVVMEKRSTMRNSSVPAGIQWFLPGRSCHPPSDVLRGC
ncbi:GNAT family N-acetyltransferase [Pseudarthrobacter sp. NPDC055928]|uniref:GNAT family N-acetyltransferase n=1 Tax=Pseudarthrobacter sp. NPDC055928 TaxID=3345661 RepID=UPI0035D9EAA3